MSDMKLYEGISHIDDDLIDEAADSGRRPKYYTFALSAAAILLAVGFSGAAVSGKDLLSRFDPHSQVIVSEETAPTDTAVTTVHLSGISTDISYPAASPATKVSGKGSSSCITSITNGNPTVTASAETDKISDVTENRSAVTRIPSAVYTIPLTDAAVTTVITEDMIPVTTETVSTTSHSERRIIMKRQITSLITASILSSVTPTGVQAKQPSLEYTDYAKECFATVESGDIDLDVNEDGVFDTVDLYQTYLSFNNYMEDISLNEKQYKNALRLCCMYDDIDLPFDYYFYKNDVLDPDDFRAEKYTNSNGEVTLNSYRFLNYLNICAADCYGCLYDPSDPESNHHGPDLIQKYYREHIKNGDIDIDFNCDGKTDIYDLFTLCIFENSNALPGIDSDRVYVEYDLALPGEMSEKCESFIRNYTFGLNAMDIDPRETSSTRGTVYSTELMKYFIYNTEFTTDFIDYHKYLDYLHQLFGESRNEEQEFNLRWLIHTFISPIKSEAVMAGVVSNNSKQEEFNNHSSYNADYNSMIYEKSAQYRKAILSGEAPVPDTDGDGILTGNDSSNLYSYFDSVKSGEDIFDTALDPAIWSAADQLDADCNGIAGEWIDIVLARIFIDRCRLDFNDDVPCTELEDYLSGYDARYDKRDRYNYLWDYYLLDRVCAEYEKAVVTGDKPAPDIDGDGFITFDDGVISNHYCNDITSGIILSETKIDKALWSVVEKMDINDDGIAGDWIDASAVTRFIWKYKDAEHPCSDTDEMIRKYNEYHPEEKIDGILSGQEALTKKSADIAGDANCDSKVNVSDAVTVLQYVTNPEKYPLSPQGKKNADIDGSSGITGTDAITIQKIDAAII